jgi:hypothetical protein
VNEDFPAVLKAVFYISGGVNIYKQCYLIVFALVFALNGFMFCYLFVRYRGRQLIIDICDPLNLFGLAVALQFNGVLNGKEILSPEGPESRPLSTMWKIVSHDGRIGVENIDEDTESVMPDDHSSVGLLMSKKPGVYTHYRSESL